MRTTGPGLRSVFGPLNSDTWYWGPPPAPMGAEARAAGAQAPRPGFTGS